MLLTSQERIINNSIYICTGKQRSSDWPVPVTPCYWTQAWLRPHQCWHRPDPRCHRPLWGTWKKPHTGCIWTSAWPLWDLPPRSHQSQRQCSKGCLKFSWIHFTISNQNKTIQYYNTNNSSSEQCSRAQEYTTLRQCRYAIYIYI